MLSHSLSRRALTIRTAVLSASGVLAITLPIAATQIAPPTIQPAAASREMVITQRAAVLEGLRQEMEEMQARLAELATMRAARQSVRIGNGGVIPNAAMTPPSLIESTAPLYTSGAWDQGIEGIVTLEIRVDSNGNIEVLRVIKGLGYGLDENAIAAVRQWKFTPARRNGVPVEVISQVDVQFNIRSRDAVRMRDGGVTPPKIVNRVEPQYSSEARTRRISGTVVLEALVTKDGRVDILRVVRGLDYGLTENAINALKQWRFEPGKKNGESADIALNIEINFHLKP